MVESKFLFKIRNRRKIILPRKHIMVIYNNNINDIYKNFIMKQCFVSYKTIYGEAHFTGNRTVMTHGVE